MGLKSFVFPDIALGMNSLADPYELRPGESPSSLNVGPALRGDAFSRRAGLTMWNGALVPSGVGPVGTIVSWNNPTVTKIVVARGDEISSASVAADVSTAWTVRFAGSGFSGVPAADMELVKNVAGVETLYIAGVNPQKWDGTAAATVNWPGGPPAGVIALKLWKQRMIAAADFNFPERLYYWPIGNPEGLAQSIDIRSSYDDDDPITDMELIGDNLLVFKRNSTWLVYDINTFANRRLGYPGVPNRKLSANLNGVVYFANKDGLWVTDGIGPPHSVEQRIATPMDATDVQDNIEACQLIADPVKERLLFLRSQISSTPAELIEYYPPLSLNNPRKEATWWRHQFTPAIHKLAIVETRRLVTETIDYHLLGVGYATDDLFYVFEGNTDNGTTIAGQWKSGVVQLTEMEKLERVRRANLRVSAPVQVTMSAPGATDFVASVSAVDSSGFAKLRPELRGREFQVRFDTVTTSSFTVRDIELMFRGGKEHR